MLVLVLALLALALPLEMVVSHNPSIFLIKADFFKVVLLQPLIPHSSPPRQVPLLQPQALV
jgi:hypothetical protein